MSRHIKENLENCQSSGKNNALFSLFLCNVLKFKNAITIEKCQFSSGHHLVCPTYEDSSKVDVAKMLFGFYNIWPTSWHVVDMFMTFPTKIFSDWSKIVYYQSPCKTIWIRRNTLTSWPSLSIDCRGSDSHDYLIESEGKKALVYRSWSRTQLFTTLFNKSGWLKFLHRQMNSLCMDILQYKGVQIMYDYAKGMYGVTLCNLLSSIKNAFDRTEYELSYYSSGSLIGCN